MSEHTNAVPEGDLEWSEQSDGKKFGHHRKQLDSAAGGEKLGCSPYEVPPGCRAWPYHHHCAKEEAIYVLYGSGTLRVGEREVDTSRGYYGALPTGPAGAHQIVNSSNEPIRYLFSMMAEPDILLYPDSGKIGFFAGSAPGGPKGKRTLHKYLRGDAEVNYYDGEG